MSGISNDASRHLEKPEDHGYFFIFLFFLHSSAPRLGSAPLCSHGADFFPNAYDEAYASSPRTSLRAKGYDEKNSYAKLLRRSTNLNVLADCESLKTVG